MPVHRSDETYISEIYQSAKDQEVYEAKMRELNSWREENVYEEVPNEDQQTISGRWVIKPKIINRQHSTKVRLCATGFEEQQCFQTDSPTCSREGIRITLATIVSHKWQLHSLDIKTAFLQGKQIKRNVFLLPPKEANTSNLWHLKKCVYGLADTSRYWYLRVKEELTRLNGHIFPADQDILIWHHNNQLIGIITCFVDDTI